MNRIREEVMIDIEDLLDYLWKLIKVISYFLKLIICYSSPARLIRKAISRSDFFDREKSFHMQMLWAFLDFISWALLIVLVVKLIGK